VRTVHLFVSSPGDVEQEHRRIEHVAERLNAELIGVARIDCISWDPAFYGAPGDVPNEIPAAADCDIVAAVFWSELGSEPPPDCPRMPGGEAYPSTTAYDVLTAISAREDRDRPDVFVLRKSERPRAPIDDQAELERAQAHWDRLQRFFERWFAAPHNDRVTVQSFATVDELDQTIESLLRQSLARHGLLGRAVAWPIATKGSPFPGLAPFDADRAPVFFGCSRDVTRSVDRLKAAADRGTPFLLVAGASGVGKSSLVRAGLVPRLTAPGVVPDVDSWRVVLMRPGARPLETLTEAMSEDVASDGATVLLVIDALDDLFAVDIAAQARTEFAGTLRALADTGRVWVVATLRTALYEYFLKQADLKALSDAGARHDLALPDADQLAEIVRGPTQATGLVFESDAEGRRLDDVLLRDAASCDALPRLQFTLQRLFVERQLIGQDRRLTFAAYAGNGGIEGAIDQAGERALADLGDDERAALPGLLRQLAIPLPEARGFVSRAVPLADAAPEAPARRLVEALGAERLLLLSNPRGVPTIELAHVHVLESWQRAGELAASDFAPLGGQPATTARDWRVALGALAAALLVLLAGVGGWQYFAARSARQSAEQAERLALAERDRADDRRQLAETAQQDAQASQQSALARQDEAERQRAAAQAQLDRANAELAAARSRRDDAERLRIEAERQRDQALIAQSRALAGLAERKHEAGDDVTAALLAIEALPDAALGRARPLVAEARRSLDSTWRDGGAERPRETKMLGGGAGPVLACALSRDGGRIVTADAEGARIWDAATYASLASLLQRRSLIAVSDDGQGIISILAPNQVQIWDAKTGQESTKTITGTILAVRFGPEGARVLTAAADNSIELYDVASGRRLRVFRGHARKPLSAAFSIDGQRFASTGEDQAARIWSIADGRQLFAVSDAKLSRELAVQLSADRALVPFDFGFRLYALDGKLLVDVPLAAGKSMAAFGTDGKRIVTASSGAENSAAPARAMLWDGATGKHVATLDLPSSATCVGMSQDKLTIGAATGITQIWSFARSTSPEPPPDATLSALLELSKARLPRCLTPAQRASFFLPTEPPAWCVEMGKWPYDTQTQTTRVGSDGSAPAK
jgi:conflict system STAND superfamily ATPase/WD40 domain-containing protein